MTRDMDVGTASNALIRAHLYQLEKMAVEVNDKLNRSSRCLFQALRDGQLDAFREDEAGPRQD